MRPFSNRAATPTAAERVRSILAAAHSMTVVSDGQHTEVHRLDGTGAMGHFHLHAPFEGTEAPTGTRVPVRLELTDIAPHTRTRPLACPRHGDRTAPCCCAWSIPSRTAACCAPSRWRWTVTA